MRSILLLILGCGLIVAQYGWNYNSHSSQDISEEKYNSGHFGKTSDGKTDTSSNFCLFDEKPWRRTHVDKSRELSTVPTRRVDQASAYEKMIWDRKDEAILAQQVLENPSDRPATSPPIYKGSSSFGRIPKWDSKRRRNLSSTTRNSPPFGDQSPYRAFSHSEHIPAVERISSVDAIVNPALRKPSTTSAPNYLTQPHSETTTSAVERTIALTSTPTFTTERPLLSTYSITKAQTISITTTTTEHPTTSKLMTTGSPIAAKQHYCQVCSDAEVYGIMKALQSSSSYAIPNIKLYQTLYNCSNNQVFEDFEPDAYGCIEAALTKLDKDINETYHFRLKFSDLIDIPGFSLFSLRHRPTFSWKAEDGLITIDFRLCIAYSCFFDSEENFNKTHQPLSDEDFAFYTRGNVLLCEPVKTNCSECPLFEKADKNLEFELTSRSSYDNQEDSKIEDKEIKATKISSCICDDFSSTKGMIKFISGHVASFFSGVLAVVIYCLLKSIYKRSAMQSRAESGSTVANPSGNALPVVNPTSEQLTML